MATGANESKWHSNFDGQTASAMKRRFGSKAALIISKRAIWTYQHKI
jgi:hypothetical protein